MQDEPPAGEGPRVAAGWYPDPTGRFEVRYHNGTSWTGDVALDGQRYVAPLPDPGQAHLRTRNGLAVASLVLGIAGVVTGWMPWIFVAGVVCGATAIVTGVVARRRARAGAGRSGMATAGLVLGVVSLPLAVVGVLLTRIMMSLLSPGEYSVGALTCESDAGRATVVGEITNLEDDERGYVVMVRFTRQGTESSLGDVVTQVDPVPGGATASFSAGLTTDVEDVDCEVVDVFGEFPFIVD